MIPRIAGRPVHLITRDGTKTGDIVLTIQWSRQADPWETVSTDHNVAFDSWASVAAWLDDRARTMDAPVDDVDMPAPIREMVRVAEGGTPSPGEPAWSARDLASSIRTELVGKPHLDGRIAAIREAFHERGRQRMAVAQVADARAVAEARAKREERRAAVAKAAQEAAAADEAAVDEPPAKG